jgi:hypothetical protein
MGGRAFTFLVLRAPVGRRKKPQDINLPTTLQRSLHLHKDPTLLSSLSGEAPSWAGVDKVTLKLPQAPKTSTHGTESLPTIYLLGWLW